MDLLHSLSSLNKSLETTSQLILAGAWALLLVSTGQEESQASILRKFTSIVRHFR